MEKKLYRSRTDKKFAGVCGGLGAYLNLDPTVVRLLFVLLSLFTTCFPGLIVYIILACVVPEEPIVEPVWQPSPPPEQTPPPEENLPD